MRSLHVAALPFPSPQGTQALIHAMLQALTEHGHEAHLLCYGHGAFGAALPYPLHRARAGRSLRSGPTLEKLWLDLDLRRRLAALIRELRPDAVVAHHVEAAFCAASLAPDRTWFVAHTDLATELPTYFPPLVGRGLAALGASLDAALVRAARGVFAVSPLLATKLQERSGRTVQPLTLPWSVPDPITTGERMRARLELSLPSNAEVALYAGNLDRYQGLAPLLSGLGRVLRERPHCHVLLATAAPHELLGQMLRARDLRERVAVISLADEPTRRRVHAAADLALVPRLAPGGVPIKLLDALARGVPVIAAERALAGLPLSELCAAVDGDAAHAWSSAITDALTRPELAHERAARARSWMAQACSASAFVGMFERALG